MCFDTSNELNKREDIAAQIIAICSVYSVWSIHRTAAMSTISHLKVGQFRAALKTEKPVLLVKANQDKIRMEHYVPLCPQVVQAIEPL
jgi:hypothetical protein